MRKQRPKPFVVVANWRDMDHPEHGGAEVCCEELASRLAAMGKNVVYLTARVPGRPSSELRNGFRIVRLGSRYGVYPLALAWLARHRRLISGCIDSENGIPFFSPLVLRPRTPVVLLMHHVHQRQFARYLSPVPAAVARWMERVGIRTVYGRRTVAAVSPSTRVGTRRELGLRGPIYVVPPGYNGEIRSGGPEERSVTPLITCVGRLVAHKRPHLLVAAMPALLGQDPTVRCHIVGDGPDRERLMELAARGGVAHAITFHGAVDSAERDRWMRAAWLTVNTSEAEGWALTVIEANAMGVPVLGLRSPGLRDSIRPGVNGWLVDEDADLAAAIGTALRELRDPAVADSYSRRARAWAARFDWQATAEQMAHLLESERGRSRHRNDDRRRHTDLAMVVHLPIDLIPLGWFPSFRVSDRVSVSEDGVALLLAATDSSMARVALRRSGLPESVVNDPRCSIAVARPADLVAPSRGPLADPDRAAAWAPSGTASHHLRLVASSNGTVEAGP